MGRETHTLLHGCTLLTVRGGCLTYTVRLVYGGGERLQSCTELVYGERDFPVVVPANISMYALGMFSFELDVPKLINCPHFHPVSEDRQENS